MNKGKLIPIGGAEYKSINEIDFIDHYERYEVLRRVVTEAGGDDARIEIIPTASMIPTEVAEIYIQVFKRLGAGYVDYFPIKSRKDALMPEYLDRVKNATCLMFGGGNQLKLSTILGGTELLKEITRRNENEGLVIAGTSAGAMAMSGTMIYQGKSSHALHRGEVEFTAGLGFVKHLIIDSHFVNRGRFGRLMQAVAYNPTCIGLGLSEDTGAVITPDGILEIIGTGQAIIFDGAQIYHTNIVEAQDREALFIENLAIHSLISGVHYHSFERAVYSDDLFAAYYEMPDLLTT